WSRGRCWPRARARRPSARPDLHDTTGGLEPALERLGFLAIRRRREDAWRALEELLGVTDVRAEQIANLANDLDRAIAGREQHDIEPRRAGRDRRLDELAPAPSRTELREHRGEPEAHAQQQQGVGAEVCRRTRGRGAVLGLQHAASARRIDGTRASVID